MANQTDRPPRQRTDDLEWAAASPKDAAGRHVVVQMVRSATGAGSNYEEARAAEWR